jgi:hypothetical protein
VLVLVSLAIFGPMARSFKLKRGAIRIPVPQFFAVGFGICFLRVLAR